MQIKGEQLAVHLEQALQAVYVVYGDEPLLVLEAGDQWRCEGARCTVEPHARPLPQSLACWRALLRHESTLTLCDGRQEWAWQRC